MYKLEFCVEKYLDLHIIVQLLTKLRSDTLKLNVETGRYQNVARENRICLSYNMNALEDKYHFVLVCPAHRYIVTTLLFMVKKIHKLLQSSSKSLTIKLCRYLNVEWKLRLDIVP